MWLLRRALYCRAVCCADRMDDPSRSQSWSLHLSVWSSSSPGYCLRVVFPANAAKADVARRGVDRLGVTRGRAIAAAVVRRAEMRAAFEDLAGNFDLRLAGVVACGLRSTARVLRNAAGLRAVGLVLGRPPIGGPRPRLAEHVVDAIAVWRECRHRRRARIPILSEVLVGEGALPG